MVLLIALSAFATVALFALGVGRSLSASRVQLRARVAGIADSDWVLDPQRGDRRLLRMQDYSSLPLLQRLLAGTTRAEQIADELDRAAVPLRVGELLAISVLVGLVAAFGVYIFVPAWATRLVLVPLAFLLGVLLPRWVVRFRLKSRRRHVEAQLPDALDIMSRSLRAGSGLLISMDAVVEQIGGPIGDEFSRMRQEIGAGLGVEDAMRELDRRVASQDLHIVVTAFLVQREVGGNLTEILDNVSKTVRERISLRNELQALTSQQRFSSYIVAAVPPLILVAFYFINPEGVQMMFTRTSGLIVLGIAAAMEIVGMFVLRLLITSFEV
jgi:tight adherence protein B